MSSEPKKKRGLAGRSHAESSPFRINGRPPDWMARKIGATSAPPSPSGGSTTMRGLLGGVMAERMGYRMIGDYDRLIAHAEKRCTHPYFAAMPADEQTMEAA